jgi:diguanylate cyclase (GGDEF)-like protein
VLLRGIQALEVARQAGDLRGVALVHNDLGLLYGNSGDLETALEHLLAGLRILREEGAPNLASLLNNIGNVYHELGDLRQALDFFRSAEEAFAEEGAWRGEAIAIGNLGRAHSALGHDADALTAYRRSLEIFQAHCDATYRPAAIARLASAHAALGSYAEAVRLFDVALAAMNDGHREFADEVLTAAGRFHLEQGDTDRAITLLESARSLLPPDEKTQRVYALHEALSRAYEQQGRLTEALRSFREFHRVRHGVAEAAATVRIQGLMLQFDVQRARQQEELFRLRNVELAQANQELEGLRQRLEAQNRELHRISIEDALTGLHNRRYLDLQLGIELHRAQRHRRPLCVAMCDIDHFKAVNDRFSHAVGDEVLRQLSRIFQESARASDIIVRFGGEEFLLVLPDTEVAGAVVLTERVRKRVAEHDWDAFAPGLRVTLSIGVAQLGESGDAGRLIAAADERLYAAKQAGRNRVVA